MPPAAPRRRLLRRWRRVLVALLVVAAGAAAVAVSQAERIGDELRYSPSYARLTRLPLAERVLPRPVVNRRLVTGLAVGGTASRPVLYVSSSDPRIAGGDTSLAYGDTNSGILSRLTYEPGGWRHEQLVRGLPRSRHDHAPNGLALDEARGVVYLAVGSMTNLGAPSVAFRLAPEYELSGTILRVDLDALGTPPYDLPTLDDPTRDGDSDAGDPFGGNTGLNQALRPDGGPVLVHATGLRNPYDLVRTRTGRLYVTVNGSNAGVGGAPRNCSNEPREGGPEGLDSIRNVTVPGSYGGHPNPARHECRTVPPSRAAGTITTFESSTNGIAEYAGDLLTVSFDGALRSVDPDRHGTAAQSVVFERAAVLPLDVTTPGDAGRFPGSIWIADWAAGRIVVLEPRTRGACSPVARGCFRRSLVRGAEPHEPTSLAFGPDGRLYVAEQDGLVRVFTIERSGDGVVGVAATETITTVRDLPNHDDDGRPAARLPLFG